MDFGRERMSKKSKAEKHARRIAGSKRRKAHRHPGKGRINPSFGPWTEGKVPSNQFITDMALDVAIREVVRKIGRENALKVLLVSEALGIGKYLDMAKDKEPQPQTDKIQ